MSKKDFIALADNNRCNRDLFSDGALDVLASFCKGQNGRFLKERWLGYIRGENGPSGGTVKKGTQP